jgi:hypothetical protein
VSAASPELVIEVLAGDGSAVLGCAPAALGPFLEDAAFRGVLAGRLPNDGRAPHFELELRLAGPARDRIESIALHQSGEAVLRYPWTAFGSQARCLVEQLIAQRRLAPGESARWRVRPAPGSPRRPRARLRAAPYPLHEAALGAGAGELDVVIAAAVLEARRARLLGGGGVESAALLLGEVERDSSTGAARVRVLEQIELVVGRAGASSTHFALDAGSFAAAAQAARTRPGKVCVGWFHDHPACAGCALSPGCARDTVFFSTEDYAVHASAFGRAYQVALVAGKLGDRPASEPGFRLYGWSGGQIAELPFRTEA